MLDIGHPFVSAGSTRNALPPLCRVFKGFDSTELLRSEISHDVKVDSAEVCYMPQRQSGNLLTSYG